MKLKIVAFAVVALTLCCMGCVEKDKDRQMEIQTLQKSIQFLNSNKECLEESVQKLNKQLTATKYQIMTLERRLDRLNHPDSVPGFWEGFSWNAWQLNFVLLLLFVLWLLYRNQSRQKK